MDFHSFLNRQSSRIDVGVGLRLFLHTLKEPLVLSLEGRLSVDFGVIVGDVGTGLAGLDGGESQGNGAPVITPPVHSLTPLFTSTHSQSHTTQHVIRQGNKE